jgi:hypothetical protein
MVVALPSPSVLATAAAVALFRCHLAILLPTLSVAVSLWLLARARLAVM